MKKKVLLAGYPKSGNTWLGYMLSYLLNAEYIEPYNYSSGILYSKDHRVLSLTCGDLQGREKTMYKSVIKTHGVPPTEAVFKGFLPLTDKVILIIRDPRDVAVSYYYYQQLFKENRRTGLGSTKHASFLNTLRKWRKHTDVWLSAEPFVVKYEDLLANGVTTLKNIMRYLDLESAEDLIKDTLMKFSFDDLKRANNHTSKFFRKGISGDYRRHFSKIDHLFFKLLCSDLANKLGYFEA